jgi:hypothetical protein
MNHTRPLGDYLLGVYCKLFLEYFEQKSLKIYLKIFKIFNIFLCFVLHKNFAKNMALSKKIQVHLQVLLLLKNTSCNVFKVLLRIFHSLDSLKKV